MAIPCLRRIILLFNEVYANGPLGFSKVIKVKLKGHIKVYKDSKGYIA